tara:strand:+ start:267 stop:533 length:267 start_codon:yes stop_codon:yes gene_type:complete
MESNTKKLKSASHQLKPVVIIGSQGLSESVQSEIDQALQAHELIKVRVNASTNEARQDMIENILDKQDATLVNQIGHIAVIYRKNEDS